MTHGELAPPDYRPRAVADKRIGIGLVGCGFISGMHLAAYRDAGFNVLVLCDRTLEKADARRKEFFPAADVTENVEDVLDRNDVAIVDIATHVNGRADLIARALRSGHHVLSQKPFVRDLDEGLELVSLARDLGRILAVNQNGRWAPHFAAALAMVRRGDIGEVLSADFAAYWPHDQDFANDSHFSEMEDLVTFDFGIHWFDIIAQLLKNSGRPLRVYSTARRRRGAMIDVPMDTETFIEYERAAATILFRAASPWRETGSFRIEGTEGVIVHQGLSLGGATIEADTAHGKLRLDLEGTWWSHGMLGAMSEVICAVQEGHEPSNDATTALSGLELAYAAQESIRTRIPFQPGSVRTQR